MCRTSHFSVLRVTSQLLHHLFIHTFLWGTFLICLSWLKHHWPIYVIYICVISLKLFEWRAYELASI